MRSSLFLSHRRGLLTLLAGLVFVAGFGQRVPKAVFVIIDGVPADVVERLDLPALKAIADSAGYARCYQGGARNGYSETPTISAPGYNNILTGVWANKHNVRDNDIADPNYNFWHVFRAVEKTNPRLKTAMFSTWLDNRTKLIGEGVPEAGNIQLDYAFDGLENDTVKYPHDKARDFIRRIDDAVSWEAARFIKEQGPDLSWVYLEYPDDMGHAHGDSPQMDEAVKIADANVGKLWDAIQKRQFIFEEDWLVIVTTDHGRDSVSGMNHGGQSARERTTWIYTNSRSINSRFTEGPAAVDIFPSICNHLRIRLPEPVRQELDGVPFVGDIDFSNLKAVKTQGMISLTWTSHVSDRSKAEVFVSETNTFREGEQDKYTKLGEVFINNGRFTVTVNSNAPTLKILLKGPHHFANVWVQGN